MEGTVLTIAKTPIEKASTTESTISAIAFDPSRLKPADRFELFSQRVRYYDVKRPESVALESFIVSSSSWHLGGAVVSQVRYGIRDQVRSRQRIRSDQIDHYRLILQHEGSFRVDADGRQQIVGPGQILLTDMARPEVYSSTGGFNSVFFFPRDVVEEALPRPLDLHGVVPQGAARAVLGDLLTSLLRNITRLSAVEATALTQSVVSMIAASIAPSMEALTPVRGAIEATMLRQACRYIDFHLTEPGLNADRLCTFLGISRASVYRLFEPLGGVAAYVKERKLERLHDLLTTSTQTQYLSRLALDHGFSSPAQFSRVFKERFGYSPSEAMRRPMVMTPALKPEPGNEEVGLFDWLHSLRG